MKNLFCILSVFMFAVNTAAAQTVDLASELMNSGIQEKNDDKKKSSTKTISKFETSKDENAVADDRGIFSFLNFSFIKKTFSIPDKDEEQEEPAQNLEPTQQQNIIQETPLQRKIRRANEGNVDAQLALGYMYLYGEDGVAPDYEQAFKFYEMAANQNNQIALNNLGSLYFNGIGTKRDYLKAAQLFELAAKNGSSDAAVNLAFIYLSSEDNQNAHNEAIKLFAQAAQSENETAKFMLGYAYYKGFHIEQNYHKAVELMKASANAQFDEGQYILALMYMNGNGIAQNYGNAVNYLKKAASQGNLQAMVTLADILAQGTIYPKNPLHAHIYYNIAAIDNTPHAAERRDAVKSLLKIDELLQAQSEAENFKPKPSELTLYIRQTFGPSIRRYIDDNLTNKL